MRKWGDTDLRVRLGVKNMVNMGKMQNTRLGADNTCMRTTMPHLKNQRVVSLDTIRLHMRKGLGIDPKVRLGV
jgi:hypothetical protein